jgi:hypothetical protein
MGVSSPGALVGLVKRIVKFAFEIANTKPGRTDILQKSGRHSGVNYQYVSGIVVIAYYERIVIVCDGL